MIAPVVSSRYDTNGYPREVTISPDFESSRDDRSKAGCDGPNGVRYWKINRELRRPRTRTDDDPSVSFVPINHWPLRIAAPSKPLGCGRVRDIVSYWVSRDWMSMARFVSRTY